MGPKKRARKEDGILVNPIEEDCIQRKGVTWRKNPTKCVAEMRPPNWKWKLNFGSYDTEAEAMVARDYGAFLRGFAGEKDADAGGFGENGQLYEFKESRDIFESMEETKARRDKYKSLLPLYQQLKEWTGDGNPPHHEFCREARKDIAVAIEKFRGSYPDRLVTSRPTETRKDLPKVEPVDGGIHFTPSSSRSEVRVSPEPAPGRESGAITGDAASLSNGSGMPVQIAVAVNGSPLQILLDMKVSLLHEEQILKIVKACIGKIEEELNNSWFEKFLEELEPCPVNPASILDIV